MKIKSQLLLIVLVLFLLCFFYVWPGVWRYRYYSYSSGLRRVDKVTGHVQYYDKSTNCWKTGVRNYRGTGLDLGL